MDPVDYVDPEGEDIMFCTFCGVVKPHLCQYVNNDYIAMCLYCNTVVVIVDSSGGDMPDAMRIF